MTTAVDIAVIDYGMGNLHSIAKALRHIAPERHVWVGDDPELIKNASHVVYPGVGAIGDCMAEVRARGLDQVIHEVAQSKPLLGICVGMQGMMARSDENGGVDCLGLLPSRVQFFSDHFSNARPQSNALPALKVPHMGWNQVEQTQPHRLWQRIESGARFYFVHSYFVAADDCAYTVGKANYGIDITAMLVRDNICAVQFHPEKSHHDGLQLLKNFVNWDGAS